MAEPDSSFHCSQNPDVELINFDRSIWLDHSGPRSLVAADSAPGFSRSPVSTPLATAVSARDPHASEAGYKHQFRRSNPTEV
jgi:hypothetical protein